MPACVRVSHLVATDTLSNPESHSHLSLVNVITVTLDMAVTMRIVVPAASLYVERTFNRPRGTTLGTIESEIPTATARVTINPEVTSKVDMEGSVCEVLQKLTVL